MTAVTDLGGKTFTGFAAWTLWLGIHITCMIGLRNHAVDHVFGRHDILLQFSAGAYGLRRTRVKRSL